MSVRKNSQFSYAELQEVGPPTCPKIDALEMGNQAFFKVHMLSITVRESFLNKHKTKFFEEHSDGDKSKGSLYNMHSQVIDKAQKSNLKEE